MLRLEGALGAGTTHVTETESLTLGLVLPFAPTQNALPEKLSVPEYRLTERVALFCTVVWRTQLAAV